ncbi:MAG: hypothetical protein ACTS4V_01480 [Candidatus Hodgkinia cicadicola]
MPNIFASTLTFLERNLAYSLAWLSGFDILEHAVFSDGVFNILRSALLSGGLIFTDCQPLQQLLLPTALKHKVVSISEIVLLRAKTPYGPYNDVLAKIASVLNPSSCVLSLGTCQNVITSALSALRSNAIPAAALTIGPRFPIAADVWGNWFDVIALSPTIHVCAIQTPFESSDVFAVTFGVLFHWTPSPAPSALPAPLAPILTPSAVSQTTADNKSSSQTTSAVK